jgi:hypothetical protein
MVGVNRWMGVCENGRVGSAKDLPEGRRAGLVVAAVATAVQHERAAEGSMPEEDLAGRREDERRREATVGGF